MKPRPSSTSERHRISEGTGLVRLAGMADHRTNSRAGTDPANDPYRWLEDVTGEEQLAWVRKRNTATLGRLTGTDRFAELRDGVREVLDSQQKIPHIVRRGGYRYNFWQDADHPRGQWRRTTLEEYRADSPEWDVLIDVDSLGTTEGENWVWAGAQVLKPDYRRALVSLSRGGADAHVVREFDLESREFVRDGFEVPEAKTDVHWIADDHIYVGTDFGPGSLTDSGYPRTVRRWRRGTPLGASPLVYEGKHEDIAVSAQHDHTPGYERDFVTRAIDFYRSQLFHLVGGDHERRDELRRVEVPEDAIASVQRDWLLVELRTAWAVSAAGPTYPAGALLAARFEEFMAGRRDLTVLFAPDPHTSLAGYSWTRHHLILTVMRDVASALAVLTPPDADGEAVGSWRREPLEGVPEFAAASAVGTDPDTDDEYLMHVDGYLTPPALSIGTLGSEPALTLKRGPAFFDTEGMTVEQHFATSSDGTRVPYFVVRPAGAAPSGGFPTLLTGYGGFEVPLRPAYGGGVGRAWLARGGCFVVANIRGGGEYGPDWHNAATRENRPRAYEDFAAVAAHLHTRGITTAARLGAQGGSNGGLLMGVMLTRYPELFGAIVGQVPLADMRRYHELLAGASWMAEFGDPDDPGDWAFLATYSPYHRLCADASYPPVLFTTSTRDDRVHPGHARKMAARLHELGHQVDYYENIEGGHGGAADNEQRAFLSALAYEFLWQQLDGERVA